MFVHALDVLTEEDVQAFVDARIQEGFTVDYKGRDVPQDLGKTVAAMMNTNGGVVVLGVEEQQCVPSTLVGVVPTGRSDLKVQLSQKILTSVSPSPSFRIGTSPLRDLPGRLVAIIEVLPGDYPPYAYLQSQFLVRRGAHNEPATLPDLELMFARRGRQQKRINETLANFHQEPVEPLGTLATEDIRRMLRLQLDLAPLVPLSVTLERGVEQALLGTIKATFGWTDVAASIASRRVSSVEFTVADESLGTRRWMVRGDGHLTFATPVVHGAMRDGANRVFLTDVAADLMKAIAWAARCARQLGADGMMVVQGELWTHGAALDNDSRKRVHSIGGHPVGLQGVELGPPGTVSSCDAQRVVALSAIETRAGAAELAAEILRVALRAQYSADVDVTVLETDLRKL